MHFQFSVASHQNEKVINVKISFHIPLMNCVGSISFLVVTSFWEQEDHTGQLSKSFWTLDSDGEILCCGSKMLPFSALLFHDFAPQLGN